MRSEELSGLAGSGSSGEDACRAAAAVACATKAMVRSPSSGTKSISTSPPPEPSLASTHGSDSMPEPSIVLTR